MKVLIIEDQPAIQVIVAEEILKIEPNAQIISYNGIKEAIDFLENGNVVDFVISDLELKNGYNTQILIYCGENRLPMMVYSSHVNKVLILEIEANNVQCYVSKKSEFHTLKLGITSLFNNESYFCPTVLKTIQSNTAFKSTDRLDLTKSQKKIIDLLSKGFNREESAKMLNIKNTTLNNQIARAREKNLCENLEELIRRYNFWDYSE